jgi:transcriptional regulator with XRE-family HTH domain
MAEQDLEQPQVPIDSYRTAGERLRQARERLGLSRADIAARTKIAERHLAAIEEERYADLASSTYAVGFSRAYARAVGLDEREIAQMVRVELELVDDGDSRPAATFEPGDPARVPSSRTAWLAGIGAVAVIVAVLVFWGGYYFPAGSLPDLTSDTPAPLPASTPKAAASAPAPVAPGPVVITAKEAGVWVKVTDAAGQQLFQKQLALGESYTVPADANGPQLRTARPDALSITVGGRAVPPLAGTSSVLTVPISAAALLARAAPPAPAAAPTPGAHASPVAPARASAPRPLASEAPAAAAPSPAPSPSPAASPPAPAAEPAAPAAAAPAAEAPKASTVSQ